MRIACCITKATGTHSEYVILIAFPRQQWLRERASMLRLYVHCLSCLTAVTSVVCGMHFVVYVALPPTDHYTGIWETGCFTSQRSRNLEMRQLAGV
jgi:hypothetical protein